MSVLLWVQLPIVVHICGDGIWSFTSINICRSCHQGKTHQPGYLYTTRATMPWTLIVFAVVVNLTSLTHDFIDSSCCVVPDPQELSISHMVGAPWPSRSSRLLRGDQPSVASVTVKSGGLS